MKEFFVENYRLIILCLCVFLELLSLIILSILNGRKSKFAEPFYEVISKLPSIICLVEKEVGAGYGEDKKSLALAIALDTYKSLTGLKLDVDSVIAERFSQAIEKILLTPQKKGRD